VWGIIYMRISIYSYCCISLELKQQITDLPIFDALML
jgi:hypothetical protein